MKSYNVTLSNKNCIFDSRDGIETAEEVVAFASGRGSSYVVYVDSGNGDTIKAVHHTSRSSFEVETGMDLWVFMTPEKFAAYIRKYL